MAIEGKAKRPPRPEEWLQSKSNETNGNGAQRIANWFHGQSGHLSIGDPSR